jgi:organic hydroperoxide reductase OsmC/OhrA
VSEHSATIDWRRTTSDFRYATYNRSHVWRFESGVEVPACAAPANIPPSAPRSKGVDPEEGFVAAISSCHMLWFLHIACTRKFIVDRYTDSAVGFLEKDRNGKVSVTRVSLRPEVTFAGENRPTGGQLAELHREAHEECFIANSVKTEIVIEPR